MLAGLCLYIGSVQAGPLKSPSEKTQDGQIVKFLPKIRSSRKPNAPLPSKITAPPIHLTPDKSEILRLKTEAGSIVVGNPAHLSILADTTKTLVLVPKAPGATHFSVLDKKGRLIMQRHVIIAGPQEHYIRIKKTCTEDADGCQATSVYYCPDVCHEILPQSTENTLSIEDPRL